jgi:septum formation protein
MTIWLGSLPLVLASQSKARQMLLRNAGIDFEVVPADIDERAIQDKSGLAAPGQIAGLLAEQKALAVSRQKDRQFVIGADQTLALGNKIFNKPAGRAEARAQLKQLAGRRHELHSAVAVAIADKIKFECVAVAHMTMRSLSDEELDIYLDAAGEAVTTSVGAYQLEGLGVHLFKRIEGDHFTILGLPLLPLLDFLRYQGLLAICEPIRE